MNVSIARGNLDAVKDVFPTASNKYAQYMLCKSIANDQTQIVKYLVQQQTYIRDYHFELAIECRAYDVLKILCEHKNLEKVKIESIFKHIDEQAFKIICMGGFNCKEILVRVLYYNGKINFAIRRKTYILEHVHPVSITDVQKYFKCAQILVDHGAEYGI